MTPETKKKLEELLPTLGKRPGIVLDRLLKHGSVGTYDLGQLGYDQPPRAAQDLKERGVRLKVTRGKHPVTGYRMAIYRLDDEQPILDGTFNGRQAFSKEFRRKIFDAHKSHCIFCGVAVEKSRLQIDHRVPYQIAGEIDLKRTAEFMPLCSSHQRTKSWTCEHCPNYIAKKSAVCKACYWAIPDGPYKHVATRPERRLDLVWRLAEVKKFKRLEAVARGRRQPLNEFAIQILNDAVEKKQIP